MMERTLSTDEEGVIVLDDTPGLGFDLDEAVLEQTRIG
jgi:L-alanine-DL-glutamate epimerase-like enolase superfamily enzyme